MEIARLAALDLKMKSAMDLAGLAALDLHCICDGFLRRPRFYTPPHVSNELKSPSSTDRIYQQANQFNQCQS